jgi:fluoroquinolone transport system permease protein
MTTLDLVRRLAISDVRLLLRDRMLATLLPVVAIIGVAARFALPAIDVALAEGGTLPNEATTLRFADTFPMLVAFIALWQAALMPGTIFGFLLLDEKEDDTLTVMQVTPVPLTRYLGYRVALPTALAVIFGVGLFPLLEPLLVGVEPLGWATRLLLVLGVAPVAPITTLLLATFAANKVQGLAFTKFGGVAGLTILIGWFVPPPWQWALGLFPPFLIAKAYWLALAGDLLWIVAYALGVLLELMALSWLLRRFRENATR